jgi:hypothetical protein
MKPQNPKKPKEWLAIFAAVLAIVIFGLAIYWAIRIWNMK